MILGKENTMVCVMWEESCMIDITYVIIIRKLNLIINYRIYIIRFVRIQRKRHHVTHDLSMSITMMRLQCIDDMNRRRMIWATSQVSLLLDR